MLSNSSKYAIGAVLYLAVNATQTQKIGVKHIADALRIPPPFLAKILQILAKRDAISSNKGPNGGFFLSEEQMQAPLIQIVHIIDGIDKFTLCSFGLKRCSSQEPCPIHHAIQPLKEQFLQELEQNSIEVFAQRVKNGEAFLFL